jgi:hypothetical protein
VMWNARGPVRRRNYNVSDHIPVGVTANPI